MNCRWYIYHDTTKHVYTHCIYTNWRVKERRISDDTDGIHKLITNRINIMHIQISLFIGHHVKWNNLLLCVSAASKSSLVCPIYYQFVVCE